MKHNFWKMSMLMIMTAVLCSSASVGASKPHYREIFHNKPAGPNNFGLLKVYASEKHTKHIVVSDRHNQPVKQLSADQTL